MSGFKKAERKQVKLKLAITGPTGSGKTYSALRLAAGMSKKIAVIDTENGSASLYADKFQFDVLEILPPFSTEKYVEGINQAERAGYEVIVIDSLTHAWAGEGGLLQQKDQLDSRPGANKWTNWAPIDKKDSELKNAFLHSPCHIICTMRSKMEYAQTEENGKKKIQKMGLAPVQRDGLTYDFTTVFDIAMDHQCEVSKDRTGLFADKIFKITEQTGEDVLRWLNSGKAAEVLVTAGESGGATIQQPPAPTAPPTLPPTQTTPPTTTTSQTSASQTSPRAIALSKAINTVLWPTGSVADYCLATYGTAKLAMLTDEEFGHLMATVQTRTASQAKAMMATKVAEPGSSG